MFLPASVHALVRKMTRPVLALLITAFASVTSFAGAARADDAAPPRPGSAKVIEFLKKQQQLQLEQQRQMRLLIEQMQKQAAPLPELPDPFPPAALPLVPGENSDIAIDQPGLKVRSVTRSSGSSYALQDGKLTAIIAEANVKATLQGKMAGGKMTLDRIELDDAAAPNGRRVYNSLDQVPAAARAVIGRQLVQWAKEARGK